MNEDSTIILTTSKQKKTTKTQVIDTEYIQARRRHVRDIVTSHYDGYYNL